MKPYKHNSSEKMIENKLLKDVNGWNFELLKKLELQYFEAFALLLDVFQTDSLKRKKYDVVNINEETHK